MIITDNHKLLRYDGMYLYLKIDGGIRKLGLITTHKGALTHEQKLKAVAHTGEWVKL